MKWHQPINLLFSATSNHYCIDLWKSSNSQPLISSHRSISSFILMCNISVTTSTTTTVQGSAVNDSLFLLLRKTCDDERWKQRPVPSIIQRSTCEQLFPGWFDWDHTETVSSPRHDPATKWLKYRWNQLHFIRRAQKQVTAAAALDLLSEQSF